MVWPKKATGRPSWSSSGSEPKVRKWVSTPVITIGIGGQPGTLMMGLSLIRSRTATAPVGLGRAFGIPPYAAQVPMETMAAACSAAFMRCSSLLIPAMHE